MRNVVRAPLPYRSKDRQSHYSHGDVLSVAKFFQDYKRFMSEIFRDLEKEVLREEEKRVFEGRVGKD